MGEGRRVGWQERRIVKGTRKWGGARPEESWTSDSDRRDSVGKYELPVNYRLLSAARSTLDLACHPHFHIDIAAHQLHMNAHVLLHISSSSLESKQRKF
jgi:hypothetical protein